MTKTKQDIRTDFYAGNTKNIRVTVFDKDDNIFPLSGCSIQYALFDERTDVVYVRKSSLNGTGEIAITDATGGECLIQLEPGDTFFLNGTFRHHVNVIDTYGQIETVLTGKVNIFESFAHRYNSSSVSAFLLGG